ncbi:MAG: NAD(P)/FAD-dependent oxidoreductase [Hyphomicrobiaceae bacterium]
MGNHTETDWPADAFSAVAHLGIKAHPHLLIIGAGPAGCATALRARQLGLSVTIVEAHRVPRPTPGETLHPGIEVIFEQLGIAGAVRNAGFHRHAGIWYESAGRREFAAYGSDETGPWLGFQAERIKLTQILWDTVRDRGAELILGHRVVSIGRGGDGNVLETDQGIRFRTPWVVDSTGRSSWLANALGTAVDYVSAPKVVTYGWCRNARLPDTNPVFQTCIDGWYWQAPLADGRVAWARLRNLVEHETTDRGAANSPESDKTLPGIDMTWRISQAVAGPGYFLTGDAAVLLDPSSSHGVLRAMMSGVLCAHVIGQVERRQISEANAARMYDDWLTGQFQHDVQQIRLMHASPT